MFHHLRDETGEGVNTRIRGRHKYLPSAQVFTVNTSIYRHYQQEHYFLAFWYQFQRLVPGKSYQNVSIRWPTISFYILVYIQTYGEISMYCARVLYMYALRGIDTRHLVLCFLKVLVRGILLKYLRKILFTSHTVVSLYHFFTNIKICDD